MPCPTITKDSHNSTNTVCQKSKCCWCKHYAPWWWRIDNRFYLIWFEFWFYFWIMCNWLFCFFPSWFLLWRSYFKGSQKKKANNFGMVNLIIDNIQLKFFSNLVAISSSLKWWSPRFVMVFLYKSLDKFTNLYLYCIKYGSRAKNLIHVLKFTTQNDHNFMQLLKPNSSKHSNTTTLLSQSY